jgi:hypothetical protein
MSKEPGMMSKVIAAVVGRVLHLPIEGEEAGEQAEKIVQLVMDTAPVAIQGMMKNLPVELQGQTLAAYRDENGNIKWDYFPASEVKKGRVKI